jgi:hypothetical protein
MVLALTPPYREAFTADINHLADPTKVTLFLRSELAWRSHPPVYQEIEGMATLAGRRLFGQSLDFAWC